jgi:cell division protease FtsH
VLTKMAEELLEKETIVLEDIERILAELRPGQYEPVAPVAKAVHPFKKEQERQASSVSLASESNGPTDEHSKPSSAEPVGTEPPTNATVNLESPAAGGKE